MVGVDCNGAVARGHIILFKEFIDLAGGGEPAQSVRPQIAEVGLALAGGVVRAVKRNGAQRLDAVVQREDIPMGVSIEKLDAALRRAVIALLHDVVQLLVKIQPHHIADNGGGDGALLVGCGGLLKDVGGVHAVEVGVAGDDGVGGGLVQRRAVDLGDIHAAEGRGLIPRRLVFLALRIGLGKIDRVLQSGDLHEGRAGGGSTLAVGQAL